MRDDQGNTTVRGLDATEKWPGAAYPPEQFRTDAGVLEGVDVIGDGIADVVGSADGHRARHRLPVGRGLVRRGTSPSARAIDLRVPPGIDPKEAQSKLIEHLEAVAPWHVKLEFEREADGRPFKGATEGPGFDAISARCTTRTDAM